jgi:hypothetical protein
MYAATIERFMQIGLPMSAPKRSENPYRGFTVRKTHIMFASFTEGLRRIATLHDQYQTAKTHGGLLVTAMPGSGKSTLLEYYAEAFPRYETDSGTVIPVLYLSAPDDPSVKDFATRVLICFGDPLSSRGTASQKKDRVIELLAQCRVEIILIDEFQHFYDGSRKTGGQKIPDWLKDIFNEIEIPIVVAGLPISALVTRRASNIQLRRRFASPYHLTSFSVDEKGIEHLQELLAKFNTLLPLPCKVAADPAFHQAMFYASNGSIGYMAKLFDCAVRLAGDARDKTLDLRHFKKAFREEVWKECPSFLNPFNPEAKLRPLVEFGEPFYGWVTPSELNVKPKTAALAKEKK